VVVAGVVAPDRISVGAGARAGGDADRTSTLSRADLVHALGLDFAKPWRLLRPDWPMVVHNSAIRAGLLRN